ncbi:MAG: hypothetical protein HFF17_04435 [Oscillospiraceae bacterium]|nr:hypothetical protein [Oscillospiraceae bacterium]
MKIWRRLCLLALVLGLLAGTAGAYQAAHSGGHFLNNVYTEGVDGDPEAEAQMLHALGLLQGTDRGFELDSPLTRAQAAVLLTRLLGGEEAALAAPPAHPFTDVPAWADAYVGWLYESGLTNGMGGGLYGSGRNIRYREYAAMLVRALYGAGTDFGQWTKLGTEGEAAYWAQYEAFPRSAAMGLTVRALLQVPAPGAETLLQRLRGRGLFTAEALGRTAYGVLPARYEADRGGILRRYVGGVDVAQCPVEGLSAAADSLDRPQDVLYAAKRENGGLTIYELRCDTLEVNRQGRAPSADAVGVSQVGGWDGRFCLAELRPGDEKPVYGALLGWPDGGLEIYWTAGALWGGEAVPAGEAGRFRTADGQLMVLGGGRLHLLGEGRRLDLPWPAAGTVLSYSGDGLVGTSRREDGTLEVFVLDAATGETRQSLALPPADFDGDGTAEPLTLRQDGWFFVGSAGAYTLQDGTLVRLLEIPTVQVVLTRNLWPYFLTYTPGVSPLCGGRQTGDGVYSLDNDGAPDPILTAGSGHGVRFLELTDYCHVTGVSPDGVLCSYFAAQDLLGIIAPLDEDLSPAEQSAAAQRERTRLIAQGLMPAETEA